MTSFKNVCSQKFDEWFSEMEHFLAALALAY